MIPFQNLYQPYRRTDPRLADVFDRIHSNLQQLTGSSSTSTATSTTNVSGVGLIMDLDLSTALMPITSPSVPVEGQALYVFMKNPNGVISWDTSFIGAPVDIAQTGQSYFWFVGHSASWYCFGYRTGV